MFITSLYLISYHHNIPFNVTFIFNAIYKSVDTCNTELSFVRSILDNHEFYHTLCFNTLKEQLQHEKPLIVLKLMGDRYCHARQKGFKIYEKKK